MTVMLVLIEVIGTHDAPGSSLLYGGTEGRQVDLVQGTVADDDVHLMTILLVIVQTVVLHAGSHALRLESLYVGHHHPRGEIGILTHILEVTTSEWGTEDIHAWAQDDALLTVEGLFAEALAIESGHSRIPRGSETGECGERHTRIVGLSGLYPLVPEHIRTHPVRAVVSPQVGEAETFHTRTRELRLRMDHGDLLIEGHAFQCILDTLFHRFRLIEVDRSLGFTE